MTDDNGFEAEVPLDAATKELALALAEEADQARRRLRAQAEREAERIVADAERMRAAAAAEVARLQTQAAELLARLGPDADAGDGTPASVSGPQRAAAPQPGAPPATPAEARTEAERLGRDARRRAERILCEAVEAAARCLEEASRTGTAIVEAAGRTEPAGATEPAAEADPTANGGPGPQPTGVLPAAEVSGHRTFSSAFAPSTTGDAWTKPQPASPRQPERQPEREPEPAPRRGAEPSPMPLLGSRGRHAAPSAIEEVSAARAAEPGTTLRETLARSAPDPALAVPSESPERRPWAGRRRRIL